jgi:hypothetical protein
MDSLTFISKLIDSLAWPVAAIVLGLTFRKKLLDLIPTLRKLKAGPLEAEFELATKRVLAGTVGLGPKGVEAQAPQQKSKPSVEDTTAELVGARTEPTAAIIEGWSTLVSELHKLGRQIGIIGATPESQQNVYQEVIGSDVLPAETKNLVRRLGQLRNQVAHAKVIPSPDSAQDYLVAINRVLELIRNYRKNLPSYTADVR